MRCVVYCCDTYLLTKHQIFAGFHHTKWIPPDHPSSNGNHGAATTKDAKKNERGGGAELKKKQDMQGEALLSVSPEPQTDVSAWLEKKGFTRKKGGRSLKSFWFLDEECPKKRDRSDADAELATFPVEVFKKLMDALYHANQAAEK